VFLGLGRSTLYRAVNEGRVPFPVHQIGGVRYISRVSIRRLLEGTSDLAVSSTDPFTDEDEDAQVTQLSNHPTERRCGQQRVGPQFR
jgi:hypothetical protein